MRDFRTIQIGGELKAFKKDNTQKGRTSNSHEDQLIINNIQITKNYTNQKKNQNKNNHCLKRLKKLYFGMKFIGVLFGIAGSIIAFSVARKNISGNESTTPQTLLNVSFKDF